MRTADGSRPARSAACRTVATARLTVSSVKKVWRTTMSKARPARANEFGPKATSPSGMSSSKRASRWRIGKGPGRAVMTEDDFAVPEAPEEPDEVLHLRRGDPGQSEGAEDGVDPPTQPQGEPPSGQPVHGRGHGGRDQRMPGVLIGRRGGDAEALRRSPGGTREGGRLLDVVALRDERRTEALGLPVGDLADERRRRVGGPGQKIEPELVERGDVGFAGHDRHAQDLPDRGSAGPGSTRILPSAVDSATDRKSDPTSSSALAPATNRPGSMSPEAKPTPSTFPTTPPTVVRQGGPTVGSRRSVSRDEGDRSSVSALDRT